MKKCTKCLIFKNLDCFNKNKRKRDGLQTYCRDCTKESNNLSYVASKKRRDAIYKRNKKIERIIDVFYQDINHFSVALYVKKKNHVL